MSQSKTRKTNTKTSAESIRTQTERWTRSNLEASRIILAAPDKHSLMQITWARMFRARVEAAK